MKPEVRLLIVDDDKTKRERVRAQIVERLGAFDLRIEMATNYEEAIEALRSAFFDLVILDLVLPAAGHVSADSSRALIEMVLRGVLVAPTHLIGLTQYKDIGEQKRAYYDQNLFALEFYSEVESGWAERICNKIRYLVVSRNAYVALQGHGSGVDVLILTARYSSEYVPIRDLLFDRRAGGVHPLWKLEDAHFGRLDFGSGPVRGAIVCIGEMGMAPAAALASQAIGLFRPRLVAMLGMCCGFASVSCSSPNRICDVVVARDVACWEEGKFVEAGKRTRFSSRSKARLLDDDIREHVRAIVERGDEYIKPALESFVGKKVFRDVRSKLPRQTRKLPEVKFGTMVSGSSVIADRKKVSDILARHPSSVALDMEMYGVYAAVDRSLVARPSVLGIKGVADFGTGAKTSIAQRCASTAAAIVFKAIARQLFQRVPKLVRAIGPMDAKDGNIGTEGEA